MNGGKVVQSGPTGGRGFGMTYGESSTSQPSPLSATSGELLNTRTQPKPIFGKFKT